MEVVLYILAPDHTVIPATDVLAWGHWISDIDNRRVAYNEVNPNLLVSTIFSGINRRIFGDGPPLFFETVVLAPNEIDNRGASTWDEAMANHTELVAKYGK